MSLFDSLGSGNRGQAQTVNAQQAVAQLQADPVGVLGRLGLSIPAGMNNPQQIVQHLMQSGQVPQNKFAQAAQIMSQLMGGR